MITLRIENDRIIARLREVDLRMESRLTRAINAAAIDLQGYIRREKLHGGVLKSRSGNLSRAVTALPAHKEGTGRIVAEVAVDKTAPYGRFHEYGVAHSWTIQPRTKKALAFTIGGQLVFAKRVTHPGLKERSFMRSGLQDRRDAILARIQAAVGEAIRGEGL